MKAKISPEGHLLIKRKGKWVEQFCPYTEMTYCSHWCPWFKEPDGHGNLDICRQRFEAVEDERKTFDPDAF